MALSQRRVNFLVKIYFYLANSQNGHLSMSDQQLRGEEVDKHHNNRYQSLSFPQWTVRAQGWSCWCHSPQGLQRISGKTGANKVHQTRGTAGTFCCCSRLNLYIIKSCLLSSAHNYKLLSCLANSWNIRVWQYVCKGKLNNSIFGEVVEFHVTEGFPWANHCDVCAKALHAGDVVSDSECKTKKIWWVQTETIKDMCFAW